MGMKKMQIEPGVKYKGYYWVNEFGEIQVQPEQTGVNAGRMKAVKDGDGWTLKTTQKQIIAHINIDKGENALDRMKLFMNKVNEILVILQEYDF